MKRLGGFFGLLKTTAAEWTEDKASRLAAALAYYTIFALAPLLIIAIGVAGLVFGQEAASGQLFSQLKDMVGATGAEAIQSMIKDASKPTTSVLATVIGVLVMLFGASGVFAALQDALNTIWEVEPRPGLGILATIRARLLSFGMVLSIGFLLLVSLVLSAALAVLGSKFGGLLGDNSILLQILNFVISFGVITLLFATLYKVLPDVEIQWREVWAGALFTALLFTIGKFLIGLYLGYSSVGSSFGAAGSLVVLLLWINYSAQIFLFGAEFTQVYATAHGSWKVPTGNAVAVGGDQRKQQGMAGGAGAEKAKAVVAAPSVTANDAAARTIQPPPAAARPDDGVAQAMAPLKADWRQLRNGFASFARGATRYYAEARTHLEAKRERQEGRP